MVKSWQGRTIVRDPVSPNKNLSSTLACLCQPLKIGDNAHLRSRGFLAPTRQAQTTLGTDEETWP